MSEWIGFRISHIQDQANGIRVYTNEVRLRGLTKNKNFKPAQAGLVCIAAVSTAKLPTRQFPIRKYRFIPMVKCLISNVVINSTNIVMADSKGSIAALPFEEFTRINFMTN